MTSLCGTCEENNFKIIALSIDPYFVEWCELENIWGKQLKESEVPMYADQFRTWMVENQPKVCEEAEDKWGEHPEGIGLFEFMINLALVELY